MVRKLNRRFQILRRRGILRIVYVFGFISSVFLLIYIFLFSPLFRIQDVLVSVTPPDEIGAETWRQEIKKRIVGENLILLRKTAFSFLKDDRSVFGFRLQRKWPHSLRVHVERRVPVLMLSDSQGRSFLVSSDGMCFMRGQQKDLPVLSFPSDIALGERIETRTVKFVIDLIGKLSENRFSCESITLGEPINLRLSNGPLVIISQKEGKIDDLLAVLRNYRARGLPLKKIDLRTENPLIEYQERE